MVKEMPNVSRLRLKPYLKPFERALAERELEALTGSHPLRLQTDSGGTWAVIPGAMMRRVNEQITYWDRWENSQPEWTRQAHAEASALAARNGISPGELCLLLPTADDALLPTRRILRYGSHGLHEYRGKFFPQLVRSLMNIAGMRRGDRLIDPMCGSGTTLVEGSVRGASVVGFDLNPLSVMISQAKVESLKVRPRKLVHSYELVRDSLREPRIGSGFAPSGWLRSLPAASQEYLLRWFPEANLLALDEIMRVLNLVRSAEVRRLMLVSLSNVLRRASYQAVEDLRVRRRAELDEDSDPCRLFLDGLSASVKAILALHWQTGPPLGRDWHVAVHDARLLAQATTTDRFDLCITSPPYATALPYIDTDRLSLTYLNLAPRARHRELEGRMIGNREITGRRRREYAIKIAARWHLLTPSVQNLIQDIEQRNQEASVGFRRRNLPVLLAKYFVDMREVLTGLQVVLRPGSSCFIVVGRNHTIAGGSRVDIPTDLFLTELAERVGYQVVDLWPMEMLRSRDIFKANGSSTESVLWLKR